MILLSFDIEEFDMPFEYGKEISFDRQIQISERGSHIILNLLKKHDIKATFFSTLTFAQNAPNVIQRIVSEGHELASHTVHHSSFKEEDLKESLVQLQKISGLKISGFRMPRMQPVNNKKLKEAGYVYDSSINPTWLPGRYNNLDKPRKYYIEEGIVKIPASVGAFFRFPLFWLSFHNLPVWLYTIIAKKALKKDGYLNIYFHPWEFTDLSNKKEFGFPKYVSKNSGDLMKIRLDEFITTVLKENQKFDTLNNLVKSIKIG